jgi:hypothetical protein
MPVHFCTISPTCAIRFLPVPQQSKTSAAKNRVANKYHKYHPFSHRPTTMIEDPCVAFTSEGIEYREFSCLYPVLEPFYFRYVRLIHLSLQWNSLWSAVSAVAVAKCQLSLSTSEWRLEKFRHTTCRAKTSNGHTIFKNQMDIKSTEMHRPGYTILNIDYLALSLTHALILYYTALKSTMIPFLAWTGSSSIHLYRSLPVACISL